MDREVWHTLERSVNQLGGKSRYTANQDQSIFTACAHDVEALSNPDVWRSCVHKKQEAGQADRHAISPDLAFNCPLLIRDKCQ